MQHRALLAVRKRAKNAGYKNIKIVKSKTVEGAYDLTAIDPLCGNFVSCTHYPCGFTHKLKKRRCDME